MAILTYRKRHEKIQSLSTGKVVLNIVWILLDSSTGEQSPNKGKVRKNPKSPSTGESQNPKYRKIRTDARVKKNSNRNSAQMTFFYFDIKSTVKHKGSSKNHVIGKPPPSHRDRPWSKFTHKWKFHSKTLPHLGGILYTGLINKNPRLNNPPR